jgi:hypothetical protein
MYRHTSNIAHATSTPTRRLVPGQGDRLTQMKKLALVARNPNRCWTDRGVRACLGWANVDEDWRQQAQQAALA